MCKNKNGCTVVMLSQKKKELPIPSRIDMKQKSDKNF